jgi:hypothetical protein
MNKRFGLFLLALAFLSPIGGALAQGGMGPGRAAGDTLARAMSSAEPMPGTAPTATASDAEITGLRSANVHPYLNYGDASLVEQAAYSRSIRSQNPTRDC